jgi:hypothetical protein
MPAKSAAASGRIIACEHKARGYDPHFKREATLPVPQNRTAILAIAMPVEEPSTASISDLGSDRAIAATS